MEPWRAWQERRCAGHHYYDDERIPLYLLTVFGKNEKANLTKAERNELAKLVDRLVVIALENNHG